VSLDTASVPLSDLKLLEGNARRGNVEMIAESLREHGQYRPVVVNRGTHTGRPMEVVGGNHTVQAARSLGWETVDVSFIDVDEKRLRKIALIDNRANDVATYDDRALLDLLQSLEDDLLGTGFDTSDVDDLLASMEDEDDDSSGGGEGEAEEDDEEQGRSRLLALADIGWTEPRHETHRNDHWLLDGRHHLFVVDPHRGWRAFIDTLRDAPLEAIFAPYPNPYLLGTKLAREVPFILVQPKAPLAGHLIDKFESLFPEASIEKLPL
jgi:hypothetical protein